MDYIEKTQEIKRGTKLDITNIDILKKDMNEYLKRKDMRYSDIMSIMWRFKKKY